MCSSDLKMSQRAEVAVLTVTAPAALLDALSTGIADLCDAGSVRDVRLVPGGEALDVAVELAPPAN